MNVSGAGLGFRRELVPALEQSSLEAIDFFELAPENWLHAGGRYRDMLSRFRELKPFTAHGLSLSIGSTAELDVQLLQSIRAFLDQYDISLYTEHLSWCADDGHLYDLLPIPCTDEAVRWVAQRVRQAQDILGRQIGLENASYYFTPPGSEMDEASFIKAVIEESDCLLHLDVNNVYVNSQNFAYDPIAYMRQLPLERVCYMHVAGHYVEEDGVIVDTHGAEVIDPVWRLLDEAYALLPHRARDIPTCLERDFNFPELSELVAEVDQIHTLQEKHSAACTCRGTA